MSDDHEHIWSKSSSGLTRICDVLDCGEVQSVVEDGYLTAFSGSFEQRINPYVNEPVHLDHVLCGECEPGIYLCGTTRESDETIVPMGAPHIFSPCAVCFSSEELPCSKCGKVIRVVLS